MARPAATFRPADLEEDAPPPYAPTAPDTDSTVPDPEQHRQSYPALDTSYIVQQQQLHQQQLQQLHVGLPSTPPPPIHYYPVMSSGTSTAAPPAVAQAAYPQYPTMSLAGSGGSNAYPVYPGAASQTAYHAPLAYPVMGTSHTSSALPSPVEVAAVGPGVAGAYPVPYPSATGMPPSQATSQRYSSYHTAPYYSPPPGPPTTTVTAEPGTGVTGGAITPTAASPHFASSSPAHAVSSSFQQQQQQPVLVPSTPNVAVTTTAPTAPEANLIDLDDTNGYWKSEPPRAPHAYTSPVLPPMSGTAVLSPALAPTPVPATSSTAAPASHIAPPPPVGLPDLVTLYKCRKCGATLESDTAVCKRIHVGGFSGERQANQAMEADLNERRKPVPTGNSAANRSTSTIGSNVSQTTSSSSEMVYDSNYQQHSGARRSEESPASPPILVGSGASSSSTPSSGALGRATSMVNPSSTTHQYYTAPSTNDNYGTDNIYIRRSFSTQNPVTSLKKLWRDTKKEFSSIQQPPYSSRHHELVAPPPLPLMQPQQQQQPYPQPGQYYPQQHHHAQGMYHSAPLPHVQLGYPILDSTATVSTPSTNPFDDPAPAPIPAYNPAHAPLSIPEIPMQRQQQRTSPAPSAPPGYS